MNNRISKKLGVATLVLMLAGLAQVWVSAQDKGDEAGGDEQTQKDLSRAGGRRALEGSWNVQVTIRNCQTGDAIRSFLTLNTFMRGGTMQETSGGTPPALRSPGHGVWSHQHGREYTTAFQFLRFNPDGTYAGSFRTRTLAEVSRFGGAFAATATFEVLSPAGVPVATGCATANGTRFE